MSAAGHDVLAWHYTTGEKFKAIVTSGYLKPTGILVNFPTTIYTPMRLSATRLTELSS